jgi:hypothetical protein
MKGLSGDGKRSNATISPGEYENGPWKKYPYGDVKGGNEER